MSSLYASQSSMNRQPAAFYEQDRQRLLSAVDREVQVVVQKSVRMAKIFLHNGANQWEKYRSGLERLRNTCFSC